MSLNEWFNTKIVLINYTFLGTKRDMWKIMPPQLSQRILAILLNDSLAILTARYSRVIYSEAHPHSVPIIVVELIYNNSGSRLSLQMKPEFNSVWIL